MEKRDEFVAILMISQIPSRLGRALSATAHEAKCGLNKSSDQVRFYLNCNRVKNLSYIFVSSSDYKSSSLNSIDNIRISNHKTHIQQNYIERRIITLLRAWVSIKLIISLSEIGLVSLCFSHFFFKISNEDMSNIYNLKHKLEQGQRNCICWISIRNHP
jgi:hypothetical protein